MKVETIKIPGLSPCIFQTDANSDSYLITRGIYLIKTIVGTIFSRIVKCLLEYGSNNQEDAETLHLKQTHPNYKILLIGPSDENNWGAGSWLS